MATTWINDGDVLDHIAAADISSGDIVAIGGVVGVAITDILSGATGEVKVTGVWALAKVTGAVNVGDVIDFDLSTGKVDTGLSTATGDVTGIGIAVTAAASGDASVDVRLNGTAGTVV